MSLSVEEEVLLLGQYAEAEMQKQDSRVVVMKSILNALAERLPALDLRAKGRHRDGRASVMTNKVFNLLTFMLLNLRWFQKSWNGVPHTGVRYTRSQGQFPIVGTRRKGEVVPGDILAEIGFIGALQVRPWRGG
jgi:hypothetical protein